MSKGVDREVDERETERVETNDGKVETNWAGDKCEGNRRERYEREQDRVRRVVEWDSHKAGFVDIANFWGNRALATRIECRRTRCAYVTQPEEDELAKRTGP